MKPIRLAVIDMGSNNVHMDLFKVRGRDVGSPVLSKSKSTCLARLVAHEGRILPRAERQLQQIMMDFVRRANDKKPAAILITATAVFRKASNGHIILQK